MSAVVELVLQFIFKFGLAPWYARRYVYEAAIPFKEDWAWGNKKSG